ncbi:Glyoxylase, beta-lactamase superfamily II [bacterium A37T11]|nr:Glyoxylase, beta-lactamase superfamily II [bacterium A37T11]
MTAYSLDEGSYSVDSSKKFVPFNEKTDKKADRKGSMFIHVHPFLIQTARDLILLDSGLGYADADEELVLHQNIRKSGYEPSQVSLVLLSHLHQDHVGGMVTKKNGRLNLAFPDAEYVVQRGEWEYGYSGSGSYKTDVMDVLQRSGNLHFVEGSGRLNDEVTYELTGGHTPYHQAFHVNADGDHYFFGADVLPEPEELQHKFAAKYDYDGRKSMELRQQYGELAAAEDWVVLFYHSTNIAIGRVQLVQNTFKIVQA